MKPEKATIQQLFTQPLPGVDAHDLLMPFKRPTPKQALSSGKTPKVGAVLMLVYPQNARLHTVLMERPSYPGVHSGQISFPGGKVEADDADHTATALRETWEEVGVAPETVEVVGKWTSLYIPPSNFIMHPFLGWTAHKPDWQLDPREVASVIETPLTQLIAPETLQERTIPSGVGNTNIRVKGFALGEHFVWGATAMVIMEFREAWLRVQG
jgi:8-oxo-dGTP pyrophosphatase MutT (NUDIX family)